MPMEVVVFQRGTAGDVQRERGFTDTRTGGEDDKVGGMQTGERVIYPVVSGPECRGACFRFLRRR